MGCLFAKSMDRAINESRNSTLGIRLTASYSPENSLDRDAFADLFKQGAVVIQRLGELSAKGFLEE